MKAVHLDILVQDYLKGREEVLLQLSDLADISGGRVLYECRHALKEVVIEAGLRGVLAHLQQHGSQPLQAHCCHTSNLHSTAHSDALECSLLMNQRTQSMSYSAPNCGGVSSICYPVRAYGHNRYDASHEMRHRL